MASFITWISGRTFRPWITLGTAVTISMILMATSGNPATDIVSARAAGILAALARPLDIFPEIIHLKSENDRLRRENVRLNLLSVKANEALAENDRLRGLLEFKERSELVLLPAEVIASDPMPGVHSILLNIGTRDGAAKHMVVISDQGLVGKLARVGSNTSVAQILLDRNLGAAVRLANCREDGITVWHGDDHLLIEGVPGLAKVRLGEPVMTSGLDGVFPEGILVGKVIGTEKREGSLFLEVEVMPVAAFSRLEEVFVVLNSPSSISTP